MIDHDYQRLMNAREILYPTSDAVTAAIRAVIPTPEAMSRQLILSVGTNAPGVEFVPVKRNWRKLWLKSEPEGAGYSRSKLYGLGVVDWEMVEGNGGKRGPWDLTPARDEIHRRFLSLARDIGYQVAVQALEFRDTHGAVTVRPCFGLIVKPLNRHGEPDAVVLQDIEHNCFLVRYAAYYVICPPGEEWTPRD